MPEIPSFFNKIDFFGVLLPGYLTVTLYLLLFRPELLFSPNGALSFDLFSAIVFLVLGPAVGLALQQFHRRLYVVLEWLRSSLRDDTEEGATFAEKYAHVRLVASDSEKVELDAAAAEYDFSISAGGALLLLSVAHVLIRGFTDLGIPILLFAVSVIFLLGGYLERGDSYTPLVQELVEKYQKGG